MLNKYCVLILILFSYSAKAEKLHYKLLKHVEWYSVRVDSVFNLYSQVNLYYDTESNHCMQYEWHLRNRQITSVHTLEPCQEPPKASLTIFHGYKYYIVNTGVGQLLIFSNDTNVIVYRILGLTKVDQLFDDGTKHGYIVRLQLLNGLPPWWKRIV